MLSGRIAAERKLQIASRLRRGTVSWNCKFLPATDVAAVAHEVNYDGSLRAEYVIHDSLAADSELEQPGQVASQGLESYVIDIGGEPSNPTHDSPTNNLVKLRQFVGGFIQNPDLVRGLVQSSLPDELVKQPAGLPAGNRCLLPQ